MVDTPHWMGATEAKLAVILPHKHPLPASKLDASVFENDVKSATRWMHSSTRGLGWSRPLDDESASGNEGYLRSYQLTRERSSRMKFERRLVGLLCSIHFALESSLAS